MNIEILDRYRNENKDDEHNSILDQGLGVLEMTPCFHGITWRTEGISGHILPFSSLITKQGLHPNRNTGPEIPTHQIIALRM
jgi:hypothetical protein